MKTQITQIMKGIHKMKNNTSIIKKIFAFAFVLALLMTAFSVVALADNGIALKDFNTNEIVRTIVSFFGGIICIASVIVGIVLIFMGKMSNDHKQFSQGIMTILIGLSCGGLMITVVNMILA
mgnify:CR=1 FL=1